MPTRPPAVAGTFYEGSAERLRQQVAACIAANPTPPVRERFIGGVVPHAGLMYSGHVAAAFYIAAELPKRFIILCPNHTGFGHFAAINSEGRLPIRPTILPEMGAKTNCIPAMGSMNRPASSGER